MLQRLPLISLYDEPSSTFTLSRKWRCLNLSYIDLTTALLIKTHEDSVSAFNLSLSNGSVITLFIDNNIFDA